MKNVIIHGFDHLASTVDFGINKAKIRHPMNSFNSNISTTFEVVKASQHQDSPNRDFPGFIVAGVVDKFRSHYGAEEFIKKIDELKRELIVTANERSGIITVTLNNASEETHRYLMSTLSIMTQPRVSSSNHNATTNNLLTSKQDEGLARGDGGLHIFESEDPSVTAEGESAA